MPQHAKQQVLFIQGGGEHTYDEWDNKLVESLRNELGDNYTVRYPRMPDEANPGYEAWKPTLLSEINDLEDGAILVGHSIGGTIAINLLAKEQPRLRFSAIALIAAPFIGNGGWQDDAMNTPSELGKHLSDMPIFFYHGTTDEIVPVKHLHLYARAVPQAIIREFPDRDHQFNNDLSDIARDISTIS